MAFIDLEDIHDAYTAACEESDVWRVDYPEFERLADNGLLEDLDENLPEVNDGSLAAALFKLPKRIVSSKLTGRAKALDRDDAWITELANLEWENNIVKNANSQAPFHRKWKDAVRKAAIYGSQPIVNLFVENGDYTGSDFLAPQAKDVKLESGKVSDYDSDLIFWDIYYSNTQVWSLYEEACEDMGVKPKTRKQIKDGMTTPPTTPKKPVTNTEDGDNEERYNEWDIEAIEAVLKAMPKQERPANSEPNAKLTKGIERAGVHFYVVFQRGVAAPFYMCHESKPKNPIRTWSNPDPSGDIPVHFLFCYQDFINPYGIGIVKLAGGTQNVLDYFRQADVLATQIGIRPPKKIRGNTDNLDINTLTYTEDADWILGDADVERMELSNGVYQELPNRINMYKTSLNNLIPMGDTSVSAQAGDPNQSKTPAGVKMAAANLSIDDEDFKDNLYMTYAAVAKSMINTHFANMQGSDSMKVTDQEREILAKAGIEFPQDEEGQPSNEVNIEWDKARATFDFEVDPDLDKTKDDSQQLEGLLGVAKFLSDPATMQLFSQGPIVLGDKKIDPGELVATIVSLSTDNDKIITDISPAEKAKQEIAATTGVDPQTGQPITPPVVDDGTGAAQVDPNQPAMQGAPQPAVPEQPPVPPEDQQAMTDIQETMEKYNVDNNTAIFMLTAAGQGYSEPEIIDAIQRNTAQQPDAMGAPA